MLVPLNSLIGTNFAAAYGSARAAADARGSHGPDTGAVELARNDEVNRPYREAVGSGLNEGLGSFGEILESFKFVLRRLRLFIKPAGMLINGIANLLVKVMQVGSDLSGGLGRS